MTAGRRRADRGSAANVLPPPRRSRDGRQILPCWALTPGVAILGSQAGLRAASAPWWAICLLGSLGLAAACLRIVFPQDSPDKAAWWSERRRRQGCQCQHEQAFPRKRSGQQGGQGPCAGGPSAARRPRRQRSPAADPGPDHRRDRRTAPSRGTARRQRLRHDRRGDRPASPAPV